ncbi:hypothetical protein SAY87_010086 [Trapa incisa]|uniref:Uncharacterized protein n=1 Tax=Trapa incisa TaxID=236973 RepID=A0AAN7GTL5_9MYRT|nr:hypothetical protein SAY87_010086 [Trapa incisa]
MNNYIKETCVHHYLLSKIRRHGEMGSWKWFDTRLVEVPMNLLQPFVYACSLKLTVTGKYPDTSTFLTQQYIYNICIRTCKVGNGINFINKVEAIILDNIEVFSTYCAIF